MAKQAQKPTKQTKKTKDALRDDVLRVLTHVRAGAKGDDEGGDA